MLLGSMFLAVAGEVRAQGARPRDLGTNQQPVGASGVVWHTTWEKAKAEAKRSQRPIFFMAAAAQCNGISGVF